MEIIATSRRRQLREASLLLLAQKHKVEHLDLVILEYNHHDFSMEF